MHFFDQMSLGQAAEIANTRATRSGRHVRSFAILMGGQERFGRLAVLREGSPRRSATGSMVRYAVCRCTCGVEKEIRVASLKGGVTVSCGCAKKEYASTLAENVCLKHGDARASNRAPEYGVYRTMLSRCYNPNVERYPAYGGRGIKVCERWLGEHGYENFVADLGARPYSGATLERRDNDGDYEPGNVRWASRKEQARNKSTTSFVNFQGQSVSVADLAERFGIQAGTLRFRIARGWPESKWSAPTRGRDARSSSADLIASAA